MIPLCDFVSSVVKGAGFPENWPQTTCFSAVLPIGNRVRSSAFAVSGLFCSVRKSSRVRLFPSSLVMNPFRIYSLVLGGAAIAFSAYFMFRRKPKSAEELERKRREFIDTVGRITDGTVIDVQEMQPEGRKPATFLIFQYDVAGVSYEASQDVTYLRQLINLHSCRLGLPTSVRYDPQNPGNSIVVSERWMGLRQ